jgi:hypothetical protein
MILYKSFNSYTEAGKSLDSNRQTLSRYIDNNKLFKGKWLLFTIIQSNK